MNFVVAGGIVRSRAWCLPKHLKAVASNAYVREMLYCTGDNNDNTVEILSDFDYLPINRDGGRLSVLLHHTGHPGYKRDPGPFRYDSANMALLRNLWAEEAIKRWPDLTHLWVVDSDVIPALDCLSKLLSLDKPVVAAHVPLMDGVTPIWMEGWDTNADLPRRTGWERQQVAPRPCTLVGGCYLIRRDAWDKGIRWSPTEISEDGGFARRARVLGIEMWAHPGALTQHLMKEPA